MSDKTFGVVRAFDPGDTTAVTTWYGEEVDPRLEKLNLVTFAWQDTFTVAALIESSTSPNEVWVCEDFILRPDLAAQQGGMRMYASENKRLFEYLAHRLGVTFVLQPASKQGAKFSVFNDNVLRALGFWRYVQEGKRGRVNDHKKSALQHLLYYLYSQQYPPIMSMLRSLTEGDDDASNDSTDD